MKKKSFDSMERLLKMHATQGCETCSGLLMNLDDSCDLARKHLQDTHNVKNANHYINQGMVYGMLIGLMAGQLLPMFTIAIGLSFGMCFGIVFGSLMDLKARKDGLEL